MERTKKVELFIRDFSHLKTEEEIQSEMMRTAVSAQISGTNYMDKYVVYMLEILELEKMLEEIK